MSKSLGGSFNFKVQASIKFQIINNKKTKKYHIAERVSLPAGPVEIFHKTACRGSTRLRTGSLTMTASEMTF
jgi:hypothetical protein